MNCETAVEQIRRFDCETVVPLVEAIGADPLWDRDVAIAAGDIVFRVHESDFRDESDTLWWHSLRVRYRDTDGHSGDVYTLRSSFRHGPRLWGAEIANVMSLTLEHDVVVWRNPLDGCRLLTFHHDPHDVLINSWYLFRSVVLPMLYTQTYRFPVPGAGAVQFQQAVIRQMRSAWEFGHEATAAAR